MSWTKEAIHAVRQNVVDEIKAKLTERGIDIIGISHSISNELLRIRIQVKDDVFDVAEKAYHEIVAELATDSAHPLATLPMDVLVIGPVIAS